jgi:hypothetical protein
MTDPIEQPVDMTPDAIDRRIRAVAKSLELGRELRASFLASHPDAPRTPAERDEIDRIERSPRR